MREQPGHPHAASRATLASTTSPGTILVVDDDPGIREIVAVALTADGYRVAECGSGRDALNHLRSHTDIGVILLDLMLPIMDAAQFRTAQLRDRSLAWIPVIVMSGAVNAGPEAERIGAQAFIRKPIDLDQLKETLRQVGFICTRRHGEERRSLD